MGVTYTNVLREKQIFTRKVINMPADGYPFQKVINNFPAKKHDIMSGPTARKSYQQSYEQFMWITLWLNIWQSQVFFVSLEGGVVIKKSPIISNTLEP